MKQLDAKTFIIALFPLLITLTAGCAGTEKNSAQSTETAPEDISTLHAAQSKETAPEDLTWLHGAWHIRSIEFRNAQKEPLCVYPDDFQSLHAALGDYMDTTPPRPHLSLSAKRRPLFNFEPQLNEADTLYGTYSFQGNTLTILRNVPIPDPNLVFRVETQSPMRIRLHHEMPYDLFETQDELTATITLAIFQAMIESSLQGDEKNELIKRLIRLKQIIDKKESLLFTLELERWPQSADS